MVTLLEREHEDVEALAGDVLQLAWSHLMRREWWGVVFMQPGVWTTVHGPFESRNVADKYVGSHLVSAGPGPGAAWVVRLTDSNLTLEYDE